MIGMSSIRTNRLRASLLPLALLVGVVAVALPTSTACSQRQGTFGSADEYRREGLDSYQRGELDRALQMYSRALELQPNSPQTLADRSMVHLQRPETYDDAIVDASRAIELDPNLARAYVNRASALVDMGHSEYAQVAILGKVSSRPDSAWTLRPEERVRRAIADATRAVELDPNTPNAYFVRAHAQMDIGRADLAVDDFTRVLEGSPPLYVKVMAYAHRSQAHRNIGNLAWAIDDATRAMELAPQLADDFEKESRLVTWHGFGPDAIEATSYVNRGLAYDRQGRPDLSVEEYSQALNRDSGYIEAYVNRSNAYRSIGMFQEALEDADAAIESERYLAVAYNARALAHLGLGDADKALADVTEAIRQDSTYAMAYSNRAYVYTGQGRYDLAVADATTAISLEPDLAEAYANRAEAHLMKGDYPKAISDSSAALGMDPTLTGTLVGRAIAYLNEGEYANALSDAQGVLRRNPGQVNAVYVRGVALLKLSDGKEGRDDLERVIRAARNPTLVNLAKRALAELER